MSACKGMNCTSTNGTGHSVECKAEHAAAVAGGFFIPRSELFAVIRALQLADFHMEHLASPLAKADHEAVKEMLIAETVRIGSVTDTATHARGGSEC